MVTDRLENLKGIIQYLMADLDISHQIPHTLEERRTMMRALMNVWIPKAIELLSYRLRMPSCRCNARKKAW